MAAAKDSPRPLIGINTDYFAATKTYSAHARVNAGYFDAVLAAGGLPVLLPPLGKEPEIDAFLDKLDGIVLTGGLDMDPRRNGQAMSNSIQLINENNTWSHLARLLKKIANTTGTHAHKHLDKIRT